MQEGSPKIPISSSKQKKKHGKQLKKRGQGSRYQSQDANQKQKGVTLSTSQGEDTRSV